MCMCIHERWLAMTAGRPPFALPNPINDRSSLIPCFVVPAVSFCLFLRRRTRATLPCPNRTLNWHNDDCVCGRRLFQRGHVRPRLHSALEELRHRFPGEMMLPFDKRPLLLLYVRVVVIVVVDGIVTVAFDAAVSSC